MKFALILVLAMVAICAGQRRACPVCEPNLDPITHEPVACPSVAHCPQQYIVYDTQCNCRCPRCVCPPGVKC